MNKEKLLRAEEAFSMFRKEVRTRTGKVRHNTSIWVGCTVIGLCGLWSIFKEILSLGNSNWGGEWNAALIVSSAFYPPLIALSFVQLTILQNPAQVLKNFWTLILLIIIALSFILFALENNGASAGANLWVSAGILAVLFVFSLWIWGVANVDNSDFHINPENAAGGDPKRKLKGKMRDIKYE